MKNGFALLFTIVIVAVLLSLGILLIVLLQSQIQSIGLAKDFSVAFYAATTGMEHCAWVKQAWNSNADSPEPVMNNGAEIIFTPRCLRESFVTPNLVEGRFNISSIVIRVVTYPVGL